MTMPSRRSMGVRALICARVQAKEDAKPWYQFVNNSASSTELLIYDEIGFLGVTAKDFMRDLMNVSSEQLIVRLNSPGGDVFDGVAIYNALKAFQGRVTVQVDGLAASIASIIAMAGESIEMRSGSFLMLHHPWAVAIGNATDMRQMAETLDKIGGSLIGIYAERSKQSPDDVRALMDAVTWLNADEAVEKGFADRKSDAAAVSAKWDLSVYGAVPAGIPAPNETQGQPTPQEPAVETCDRGRMERQLSAALI